MWKNTGRTVLRKTKKAIPKTENVASNVASKKPPFQGADFILPGGLGGFSAGYGPDVSEVTYFTVLRILSESVGKLPIHVRDRKHEIVYNDAERLLNIRPNPEHTPVAFLGYLEYCRNHYGNGYAYAKWNGSTGKLEELIPLNPLQVRLWVDDVTENISQRHYYTYTTVNGTSWFLPAEDVVHVRNWHLDDRTRLLGLPVRETLYEYMTAAKAGQQTQNDLYQNGMILSGVLNYVGDLSDEKKATLLDYVKKIGTKNKVIPLPKEWELKPLNLSLADSQYLETRRFTSNQIAAAFGVSPTQLNDYSKGSYANSIAQQDSFLKDALLYISRQYEDELTVKLLTEDEINDGLRVDMDTDAILRSAPDTLATTLTKLVTGSIMKVNEARDYWGLPPVENGDKLMTMPGAGTVKEEVIV